MSPLFNGETIFREINGVPIKPVLVYALGHEELQTIGYLNSFSSTDQLLFRRQVKEQPAFSFTDPLDFAIRSSKVVDLSLLPYKNDHVSRVLIPRDHVAKLGRGCGGDVET
jgi:hypothetical protein